MLSRKAARDIIDSIRQDNGGISKADRRKTPLAVLKALESVRAKLGASTKTYHFPTLVKFEAHHTQSCHEYLFKGHPLCLRTYPKCRRQRIQASVGGK